MYRTVMEDHSPIPCVFLRDRELRYRKRSWKFRMTRRESSVEKGCVTGRIQDKRPLCTSWLEDISNSGECRFIEPGLGLVSAIREEDMLQEETSWKNQPHRPGQRSQHSEIPDEETGGGHPQAQQPLRAAYGESLARAYQRANRADRIAAFGGCVVFNRSVDKETAELVAQNYLEVLAAPDYEEGTLEILKRRSNLRIIQIAGINRLADYALPRFVDFKSLMDGGLIVQQSPLNRIREAGDLKPAQATHNGKLYRIRREPSEQELRDLLFGWFVEQGVTSNSVLYVKDECTVGIGTGEQDRVGVAEIAVFKAYQKYADALCFDRHKISYKELELAVEKGQRPMEQKMEIDLETQEAKGGLRGATMVSDAFFPFRDGVDVGLRQGITAVVQPGGSIRDWEVIEACNEANATMVFTEQRAFKH